MTTIEQTLLAEMQDLGYSHGICMTALQILSQSKPAMDDMLLFILDEQPNEQAFIAEMARICDISGLSPQL